MINDSEPSATTPMATSAVTPAVTELGADNTLRAKHFDDIYFSTDDGLAESRYVFIEGNKLQKRWKNKAHFVIGETGFGTGLNFLATWQAWLSDANASKELHYFSIEKHPLSKNQISEAIQHWPELKPLCQQLVDQYPAAVSGFHTLQFEQGKLHLTLAFADVSSALTQCQFQVDAWFLDGFTPKRNPAMWTPAVFSQIAKNTANEGSLATFTAAGQVRRDLQSTGFEMAKCSGFGRKREMLIGHIKNQASDDPSQKSPPWYAASHFAANDKHAIVIGAGIAGAQIAWHLAQKGWRVEIYEQGEDYALRASGNQLGVMAPKFTKEASLSERFSLTAWQYQLRQFKQLKLDEGTYKPCGNVQLAYDKRETDRMHQLLERFPAEVVTHLNPKQVQKVTGLSSDYAAHYVRDGGAVSPRLLVKALLMHPRIQLHTQTTIKRIKFTSNAWSISAQYEDQATTQKVAPVLVLANGAQLAQFLPQLPITPARGQTSSAKISAPTTPLQSVIGHKGYLIPNNGSHIVFGASFKRGSQNTALLDQDTQFNIDQLKQCLPDLKLEEIQNSHAAIRATTPDRWPIVGSVPDEAYYREHYGDLHLGKQYKTYPGANYQQGLYVLGGLGSRGLSYAGLCAFQLAEEMTHSDSNTQHLASEAAIREAMHPARFLMRKLKRGK